MSDSLHNAVAEPFPDLPGARGGLLPWLAVSCLAHALLLLWVSAPGGMGRSAQAPERMRLVFAEASAAERHRVFTDVPEHRPDEGEPPPDAQHVGTSRLLARDPGTAERTPDTPHVEEGLKSPVYKPGEPVAEGPPGHWIPERPGDPLGGAGMSEENGKGGALEEQEPEPAPPQDEPPAPDPAPDAPPDDEGPPPEDEAEQGVPPAPSPERRRPDPGPPRLLARVPGSRVLAAFPRGGYIQETPEGGVRRRGLAQYNVRWDEYAPYYRHLFRRIEAVFLLRRLHFRRPHQAERPMRISVTFRVMRDGTFDELSILEDGGVPFLAADIADGIRSASPADPLPDYVEEDSLRIIFQYYLE